MASVPPLQKIAVGAFHSAIVTDSFYTQVEKESQTKTQSSLFTWGTTQYGVLGSGEPEFVGKPDGGTGERPTPVLIPPPGGKPWRPIEVGCGTHHTIVLNKPLEADGGTVFAAGLGTRGRLGRSQGGSGQAEDVWWSPTFEQVPLPTPVIRIAVGCDHAFALNQHGQVYAWGANSDGQCGVGTGVDVRKPTHVPFPGETRIRHFAAGSRHSLFCDSTGSTYACGYGANGRLGVGDIDTRYTPTRLDEPAGLRCTFVAVGEAHSGMIDAAGEVFTWGIGSFGRLGTGETKDSLVPQRVNALEGNRCTYLSMGTFHSLVCTYRGKIFAWGSGIGMGLLAEDDTTVVLQPRVVMTCKNFKTAMVVQCVAGAFHSIVLMDKFQDHAAVVTWGLHAGGRLGHERRKNSPVPLELKHAKGAKPPGGHTGPQGSDPYLFRGWTGDLQPELDGRRREVETAVESQNPWEIKQVECGAMHSAILTVVGDLYIWGAGERGQTGIRPDGHALKPRDIWTPTKLVIPKHAIRQISLGSEHCLAVTVDDAIYSWGRGDCGQLGLGSASDVPEPTRVATPGAALMACAGEQHSACVLQDGRLLCWGSPESGKLGFGKEGGTAPLRHTPKAVEIAYATEGREVVQRKFLEDIKALSVSCGPNHTAVVVKNAERLHRPEQQLYTFGGGWFGRLGLGSMLNVYEPTKATFPEKEIGPVIVDVDTVVCGGYHTCVIEKETCALWVTGRDKVICEPDHLKNFKKFTPPVGDETVKYRMVACGEQHVLAVSTDGDVFVWGDNSDKQLGLGLGRKQPLVAAAEINMNFPGVVEMIATGGAHSLAKMENGDLVAMGLQTCGRLGLPHPTAGETRQVYVGLPKKVNSGWASIEAMTDVLAAVDEDDPGAEEKVPDAEEVAKLLEKVGGGQSVTQFSTMQTLIKQTPPESSEDRLSTSWQENNDGCRTILAEIRTLSEKERELERLRNDFKQAFLGVLKHLGDVRPPDSRGVIPPAIVKTLPIYEELLWILQQQACYLAQLSMCMESNDQIMVFERVVDRLFADLHDRRTVNLMLTLIRLMIDKEIEHAKTLADVFRKGKSRVFNVFSRLALKYMFYGDIVKPMLDSDDPETLLSLIAKLTSEQELRIAFTVDQVKAKPGMDSGEKEAELLSQKELFRTLMLEGFLRAKPGSSEAAEVREGFQTALKKINLPPMLRAIFGHASREIVRRAFPLPKDRQNIPDELVILDPLLYLFVMGIIVPILRKLDDFAGPRTRLTKSLEKIKTGVIKSNMVRIADYLEMMMTGKDESDKSLQNITRQLMPKMMKVMKAFTEDDDHLETDSLIDVFQSHFSLEEQTVSIRVSDCLLLTNMLHEYMNKLRLTQNDEVERLSRKIGHWNEERINSVTGVGKDTFHNFKMRVRFLLVEEVQEFCFCPASKCPVPPRLTAGGSDSKAEILRKYLAPDAAWRQLEPLFGELPPLSSSDFLSLKTEFLEQQQLAKERTPPNYALADTITQGLLAIDDLIEEESAPESVLALMSNALSERDAQRRMLCETEKGIQAIEKVKKGHYGHIKTAERYMEDLVKFSMKLDVPQELKDLGAQAFPEVFARLRIVRKVDPTKLVEAGCSFAPTQAYELKKLRKQGVCKTCALPEDMQKNAVVTMQTTGSGSVKVVVSLQGKTSKSIRRFEIPAEEISELKRAVAGTELKLDGGFMVCSATHLHLLLQKLSSQ